MKKNDDRIVLFKTNDGKISVDVRFDEETVWLTLDQMAELFERDKSTISRHIKNIFAESELGRDSVVANFATTAADGKNYQVGYYNLDVIISVGYRVKSLLGSGSISHAQAVEKAEKEYKVYLTREMKQLESDFDRAVKSLSVTMEEGDGE